MIMLNDEHKNIRLESILAAIEFNKTVKSAWDVKSLVENAEYIEHYILNGINNDCK